MSVALSIVFTGLCALVTDGDRGPAQVLLVDAQGVGEVGGVFLPRHEPTLVVSLHALANPDASRPSRVIVASGVAGDGGTPDGGVDQIGIWDLSGSEVRIRVAGRETSDVTVFRPAPGTSSWPAPPREADDAASWRDIRFLADMTSLASDGRIDPSLVGGDDDDVAATLPSSVAARVRLDGGRVEAGLPSHSRFRHQQFEFRSARGQPKARQAMTDTIRWTVDAEEGPIVVEIVPLAGGPAKRLVFAARTEPHTVFVSNLPVEVDHHHGHAATGELAAALHFGAYYRLLRHAPDDEPTLHRVPGEGERGTGLIGTQFCPPIRFRR
jgi:hypothetical protein